MISRFKLSVWIAAVSQDKAACQGLQFSYGVSPVYVPEQPDNWQTFARSWVQSEGLSEELVVLTAGSSCSSPPTNPRLEIIDLRSCCAAAG
jgi:pyruvate kinase